MLLSKKLKIFFLLLLIFGCAEENPNLVNPPLPSETVSLRFYNLAGDGEQRAIRLGFSIMSQQVPDGDISAPVKPPPSDSVSVEVLRNNNVEYKLNNKLRLIRDTKYFLFGVHSATGLKKVDSLLVVSTSFSPLSNKQNAFLSMMNLVADTSVRYSLTLGCPSGIALFSGLFYTGKSIQQEVTSGELSVSLLRIRDNVSEHVGLFKLNLDKGSEYSLLVLGSKGNEEVKLLNMKDQSTSALTTKTKEPQMESNIRLISFSESKLKIAYQNNNDLFSGNSTRITGYKTISACGTNSKDTFSVMNGTDTASRAVTSINVNTKYSLFVFDSNFVAGSFSFMVEPVFSYDTLGTRAWVRVIHASFLRNHGLTVSLGARDDASSSSGFRTGDVLASRLNYKNISSPVMIPSGRAPITVFSSTEPARLLFTSIGEFKPGRSYVVIIYTDKNAEDKVYIIEEDDVQKDPVALPHGVFTQFAHFIPSVETANLSVTGVLSSAKIYYASTLSTVLPQGSNSVSFGGKSLDILSDLSKRDLIVSAGKSGQTDLIHIQSDPPGYNNRAYRRRFINAAQSVPVLTASKFDKDQTQVILDGLKYGEASFGFIEETNEKKISLIFKQTNIETVLQRIDDIALTFGKNYSIIFGGDDVIIDQVNKTKRYSIILLQEY